MKNANDSKPTGARENDLSYRMTREKTLLLFSVVSDETVCNAHIEYCKHMENSGSLNDSQTLHAHFSSFEL